MKSIRLVGMAGTAIVLAFALTASPGPARAEMRAAAPVAEPATRAAPLQWGGRSTIGRARIFNNDSLIGGRDRWRTGSYTRSVIRAPGWDGAAPERPGALLEFRFHGEVVAPRNIANPVIGTDRRPAGILGFGVHSHWRRDALELRLGLDLNVIGPQTGLVQLQDQLHGIFGFPRSAVIGQQLGNAVHPTLSMELAREIALGTGGAARLRPFLEAQAGLETLLRVGADLTLGQYGQGGLMVRDPVAGQRVLAVSGGSRGFSLVMGGDIAHVASSALLPAGLGYQLTPLRTRARIGLVAEGERHAFFYGVTWLGKEFRAQPVGQFVGTVSLRLQF